MKIHKDLNIMVVKDKKLEIFKNYKMLFLFFIVLSIIFTTLFIFKTL
jgi:hypothetical protein